MKTLKVGIIGYGLSGRVFHGGIIQSLAEFQVCKVVTKDDEKVKLAKLDFLEIEIGTEPESVFNDAEIDLVVISTPNMTHYDLAAKALKAGKHVILEKPFTVNSSEASALVDLSKKLGKTLAVYHNRRFDSDFLTVQKIIEEGHLGRIVSFESRFERFRNELKVDSWREKNLPGSGILYDLGSHLIDQALTLFGMPCELYADIRSERRGEADDAFEIILYYENLKVTLKSSMLIKEPLPRFSLNGTEGSFVKFGVDVQEAALKNGLRPPSPDWGQEPESLWGKLNTLFEEKYFESQKGDYGQYYRNIYQTIVHGKPLATDGTAGLSVIRLLELAILSNQSKRRISL